LPQEEKNGLLADKTKALKTARGYAGIRGERLDVSENGEPDLKEVLDVGLPSGKDGDPHLGINVWPSSIPGLQQAVQNYSDASADVAKRIIGLLAKGLGSEGAFEKAFVDPLRVMRLMRYPAYNEVPLRRTSETSCGVHSDYGGVTLLHSQDPGLWVLRPNASGTQTFQGTFFSDLAVKHDDVWVEVLPKEGTFIVMFGEALHVMSNGRIQTSKHRVDNEGHKARHSLALFFDPSPDFELEPLLELKDEMDALFQPRLAGHKGVLLAAAVMGPMTSKPYLGYGRV